VLGEEEGATAAHRGRAATLRCRAGWRSSSGEQGEVLLGGGVGRKSDAQGARAGSSNRGTWGRERQLGKRRLHNL
jgi:hypothetical protein